MRRTSGPEYDFAWINLHLEKQHTRQRRTRRTTNSFWGEAVHRNPCYPHLCDRLSTGYMPGHGKHQHSSLHSCRGLTILRMQTRIHSKCDLWVNRARRDRVGWHHDELHHTGVEFHCRIVGKEQHLYSNIMKYCSADTDQCADGRKNTRRLLSWRPLM